MNIVKKLDSLKTMLQMESDEFPEFKLYVKLIEQETSIFVRVGNAESLKGLLHFLLDRMLEKKEIQNDMDLILESIRA